MSLVFYPYPSESNHFLRSPTEFSILYHSPVRDDPRRFVTFVIGTFIVAYYFWLTIQTIRIWRQIGRCPIPAFSVGGTRNWLHAGIGFIGPLPFLIWAYDPSRFSRLPEWGRLENWPVRLTGLLILCSGASVLAAAVADLGDSWRMGVEPGSPVKLVTSGIYGSIRHPIYGGIVLALTGMFLLAPNLAFASLLAAGSCGAVLQARHEDRFLESVLGEDYRAYVRRTGRLFPRLASRALGRSA